MPTRPSAANVPARILRGHGQVRLREAVRISLGQSFGNKISHISTLIWGLAFGLMSAMWSPPHERPFVIMGCFVIAAAIGYGSMVPWRWRIIPRRWPHYLIYLANGAVALLIGMALFFVTITAINYAIAGAAALSRLRLQSIFYFALFGFQFPLVGFYITVSTDLAHRGNIQRKEKERFQWLAEQARLVALRSQINPHFFFNALNTIAALIPTKPADAERAVELLATALRPVLTRDQPMTSTLRDEIQVARAYTAIEQLRIGSRCSFSVDISDPVLECLLPSLSVQPLLENAVRHGAAKFAGQYQIALVASCSDELLRVQITNGPVGAKLGTHLEPVAIVPGHALHNIQQRLEMLFGSGSKLEVKSNSHSASCVLLIDQRSIGAT